MFLKAKLSNKHTLSGGEQSSGSRGKRGSAPAGQHAGHGTWVVGASSRMQRAANPAAGRSVRAGPLIGEAVLLSAGLLAYSNGLTALAERHGKQPEMLFRNLNPSLLLLMLGYAALGDGGLEAAGVRREGVGRSLIWGALLGTGLCAPPLIFFYKPVLLDTPLEYGPVGHLTRRELLVDVLVRTPVGIALTEELAFRGLLHRALRRRLPPMPAVAWEALVFAGWHLKVTISTTRQTNLSTAARLPAPLRPYVSLLAVAGGMLTTGAAGALFGLLRERTGSIAGPVLAHWIVDGVMIAALWARRPSVSTRLSGDRSGAADAG